MSLQSEPSRVLDSPELCEYSAEERRWLLRLAHDAIQAELDNCKLDLTPPNPHLAQPRGAFTTLHLHDRLRGCIGYIFPTDSLYKTVAESARAAAFDDPRFEPVSASEAAELKLEISVLSPPHPIHADEIVVGRHGLIVIFGGRRGLLLPQVPVEWGWDRDTFLAQTCLKAGLPPDAWQHGAELQGFTAEIFGDE